ncbi:MAG: ACP S-malonyltransferase [Anaerolineae bacterium]
MTTDIRNLALVFPGQGCQFVGMGADVAAAYPQARALFARADAVLELELSRIIFEGPSEVLEDTANAQPAIYTASMALWEVLRERLQGALPQVACVAGHSLGEFTALAAGGALTFEDGLRLVRRRGEAMRDAGRSAPGGMAVVLGLSDEAVAALVDEVRASEPALWVANLNAPGQVVIAGSKAALELAMPLAKAKGAKRALPLAVSVACHTPLMGPAAERLAAALDETPFARPWAPVVSNVTATPLEEPAAIKDALLRQLSSPVRWVESVQGMATRGVSALLEVGPKEVVSGLAKRIAPDLATQSVTSAAGVEALNLEGWLL